ncbi:MAG: hypothetical protein CML81_00110 [Rhodobiaceae bacterium]|nr:hypothetical protein [Rhodobiaceae bacterium]RPF98081.1 MAG: hypothetical protein CBD87_000105 [Rhizobiales bacterium TMED227]
MSVLDNILQEIEDENKIKNTPVSVLDDILKEIEEDKDKDPIAKMNNNIQLKEKLAYEEQKKLESEEEPTFLGETAKALVGGTIDAAQGVVNLQDYLTDAFAQKVPYYLKFGDDDGKTEFSDFIPTIEKRTEEETEEYISDDPLQLPNVDKNETIAGQIARDLTRFVVGTVAFRGLRVGALTKIPKVGKVFKDPKGPKSKFAVNVLDAVGGSQLVSSGDEGRLTDLLAQIPELMEVPGISDGIEYLKSNPEDTEAQSRFKMAVEDAILAFPVEIGIKAAKIMFRGSKDPVRKEAGNAIIKETQPAVDKENAVNQTVDLLENTGNSKALLPDPLFDEANIGSANLKIKFQNKEGKELFETVNDGVEDMVDDIFASNKDIKLGAKATGTRASNEETLKRAKELGLGEDNFEEFFKAAGKSSTPEYATAARMLFIASADKVKSIADLVASGNGGTQAQGQLAKAVVRHRAIQEKLLNLKANAGRTLQAFNIPVGSNNDIRNKQISELTAAVLGGDVSAISKAAQNLSKNTDETLNKLMKDKFTDTKTDKINQLIYFNYLSSPSTYLVNTVGNAATQVYENLIVTPASAIVGAIRSPFIKKPKDKVYFSETVARNVGSAMSMAEAFKNFGKVIRDGDLPPELKRMSRSEYEDVVGLTSGKGGGIGRIIVGGVVRTPGAILLATDAFFKTLAKSSFVYQQAYRGAAKKGLVIGTKEHSDFVADIIKKKPADLEKAALEDAARVTFTKDNKIAAGFAKIKRVPVLGNIASTYLPFVRTPLNLAGYSLTNSFFALANPVVRRAIKKGGAEADEAIARIVAGSSVIGLGTYLASQGVISGTGDGYKLDMVKTQGLGYQDKAINIGNKTYTYNRFDPFATPIGFGADLHMIYQRMGAIKDTDKYATLEKYMKTAVSMTASSAWANIADKAMLTGIAQLAKDIEQFNKAIEGGTNTFDYALNKFSTQVARASTPNILRAYGRTSDPFIRDTYTALDVIRDSIPFIRRDLPIRYDMFGRLMYIEQYGEEGLDNDIKQVITSITREYSLKDDPFAKELVKLEYAHSRPSRKMSLQGFDGTRVELDLEQYSILEGYTGAQFHQYGLELIQTEAYKRALPFEKKKMIAQIKQASNAYGKTMVLDTHGVELFKKAGLNYFERRRETPYWEYLPEHLTKTYKNQQELPTQSD